MAGTAVQLWDGSVLTDSEAVAVHEDCCCVEVESNCNTKCSSSATDVVIDLGVGGWFPKVPPNTVCANCNNIAGEYTLPENFYAAGLGFDVCEWVYTEEDWCPALHVDAFLYLRARFEWNAIQGTRLVVVGYIQTAFIFASFEYRTDYSELGLTNPNCWEALGDAGGVITLDKVDDTPFLACNLAGSLPLEIQAWQA